MDFPWLGKPWRKVLYRDKLRKSTTAAGNLTHNSCLLALSHCPYYLALLDHRYTGRTNATYQRLGHFGG